MTESEEQDYIRGSRQVWVQLLEQCCRELGLKSDEASKASWISERERTVAILRQICGIWGDNHWPDNLHLADVVEKHLWRTLEELRYGEAQ
jgi:hypothetical protein